MADTTGISWTDHTFNPWWGCTKIAPGCDNCYAATFDKRTGGDYWNVKAKPRLTKDKNWNKVRKWHEQAQIENRRRRVFCGSMMDWCDKNAPEGALSDLWQLIRETPMLDWQLLTKRATLIKRRLPPDWGNGFSNVWLGVTVENMEHGYRRIRELRKLPAKVRFLSCEPLLEELEQFSLEIAGDTNPIHWIIIGGESGPKCRPMDPAWAIYADLDAIFNEIPVWFKQIGGNSRNKGGCELNGHVIQEWPKTALQVEVTHG